MSRNPPGPGDSWWWRRGEDGSFYATIVDDIADTEHVGDNGSIAVSL